MSGAFEAGALTGLFVADRDLGFETREATAHDRIVSARQVAANLGQAAVTSEMATSQNRQRLTALARQYGGKQITAARCRAETKPMRDDVDPMRNTNLPRQ